MEYRDFGAGDDRLADPRVSKVRADFSNLYYLVCV